MTRNDEILKKIKELHGPNYLTLMSITQAVVFGFFVSAVQKEYATFNLGSWILSGTMLIVIITVWYEYSIGVLVFSWVPDLSDSFIPFILAVFQLLMIGAIQHLDWWLLFGVFICVFVALAYENMFRKASQYSENTEMLNAIGVYKRFSIFFPLFNAVLLIVLYFLLSGSNELLISVLGAVIMISFVIRSICYWRKISQFIDIS